MSIVYRSQLRQDEPTLIEGDPSYSEEAYRPFYPLLKIDHCHYRVSLDNLKGFVTGSFVIKGSLRLADSRTGLPFDQVLDIEEDYALLRDPNEVGDGIIVEGNAIDLDDVVFKIVFASLPLAVHKPDSPLPNSGKGYRVLSEDEYLTERKESYNPQFDKLQDLDVKDK